MLTKLRRDFLELLNDKNVQVPEWIRQRAFKLWVNFKEQTK